jgi:hypothetical protein
MSIYDDDDEFSPFLAEDLHSKLKQYVQTYFNAAKHSASPNHALTRHEVNVVGVNKIKAGPLHESFTASVKDINTTKSHAFILERTASDRAVKPEVRFAYCTQFPDSKTVVDTIQEALNDMGSQSAEPSESQPSSAPHPTLSARAVHKAMAAARSSAQSFEVEADDTISGMKNQELGACVRQYEPVGLTLFHLVLIAFIVHEVAPIYSLFESQCYWFANVIFDVIVSIYPSKTRLRPPPASSPRVFLPADYLPNPSGQFFGITINDPRVVQAVVDVVKSRFEAAKEIYKQKLLKASSSRMQNE